jgi:hypothetical protein
MDMAKKKARMGRPPIDPQDLRGRRVTLRFTTAEFRQLERDAKRAGAAVGEFLRRCWQAKRGA